MVINDLTNASAFDDTDQFIVRQPSQSAPNTRKTTLGALKTEIGSSATFLELTDTPDDYTGEGGKSVTVKMDETGLEFTTSGSGVESGLATLSGGEAIVAADWVTALSVVTVTPTAAPSTPGTALYVDPANHIVATSFKISSDDATDSRGVFWIAAEPGSLPPLTLPTTFYVAFNVNFHADEMTADDPHRLFEIGDTVGSANAIWAIVDLEDTGQWSEFFIQLNGGGQAYTVALDPATDYTVDLKFDFAVDYSSCEVTPRIDGVALVEGPVTASTGLTALADLALGATSGGTRTSKKTFDWLTIGTGTWGDNDLFDSQFTALAPFDSQIGTGISIGSGLLSIDIAGGVAAYVLKNCA